MKSKSPNPKSRVRDKGLPSPKFGIGQVVMFGKERWRVVKYHKIGKHFEVMFHNKIRGTHHSIECKKLEMLV